MRDLLQQLIHAATRCNTQQRSRWKARSAATHCNTMRRTAIQTHGATASRINTQCATLQHPATPCNKLQHSHTKRLRRQYMGIGWLPHTATACNTLQNTTTWTCGGAPASPIYTHCNTLEHTHVRTATPCNTLQHISGGATASPRYGVATIGTLPNLPSLFWERYLVPFEKENYVCRALLQKWDDVLGCLQIVATL